ncbi:MAG: hypothetical protein GVY07_06340 [Bacteroidetes bacterium]|jgi:hypothetical protein|nr:hypothetical protein [Bacteroidota bacterium]
MSFKYRFLTSVLLFIFSGCSIISSDSDQKTIARVQAMENRYTLDGETSIGLKIENVSSNTIYYSTCGSGTIQELEGSEINESAVYVNRCYCICIISIESGKQNELFVPVYLLQDIEELQFSTDVRYRVFPHFYKDQDLKNRISISTVEMSPMKLIRK